jgi:hypothetical protein
LFPHRSDIVGRLPVVEHLCYNCVMRTCPTTSYVHRVCPVCRKDFLALKSNVKRGRGIYCNPSCARRGYYPPLLERFWSKVNKSDGCWTWTGSKTTAGYGLIWNGKDTSAPVYVHRLSWELHFGEIPDGLSVCHRCDNPTCVRPDHLFLGTDKDNSDDKITKGRMGTRYKGVSMAQRKAMASSKNHHLLNVHNELSGS